MTKHTIIERGAVESSLRPAKSKVISSRSSLKKADLQKILHELQLYQIDLEKQNEELRSSRHEMESSRARYLELYDQAPVGNLTLNKHGKILESNLNAATLLGMARRALVNQPISRFIHQDDHDIFLRHCAQQFKTGTPQTYELRMIQQDGTSLWVLVDTAAAQDDDGVPTCRVVLNNITERKYSEQERVHTARLIHLINTPGNLHEFMSSLISSLQEWSGCEAVGIRLRAGDDYPYFETRGFSHKFVQAENHLCSYGPDGKILRDGTGNPVLECMCGSILSGRFDPDKPFFTAHGSFWSNNTTALLASSTEADRQTLTRNRCNAEGYESVALIPLRSGDQLFGLMQLNDRRPDRFTHDQIVHFERMAYSLAIALSRRQTEEALRKSEEDLKEANLELQVHQIELEMQNEELRRTQHELERSRSRYFELYDQAPVGYLTLNEQGLVLEANLTVVNLLGVERDVLVKQPFSRYIRPDDQDVYCLHRKQILHMGTPQACELRLLNIDGVQFWVNMEAVAALDMESGEPVFRIVVSEIIERKRAEEKLLEANLFSEQIISSAHEGVIVYDLDLRYRVWNPFMEQLSGMTAGEVLGRHPSELFPFMQEAGLIGRLEKVLAGETPPGMEYKYSDQNTGKTCWVSNLSAPLRNIQGEIVGVIATIREITDRKKLDDELRQALETAKSANSTMSRLLFTVAHEFRTPLGLLTGSTDILDRYWDRLTPEKRFEQNLHIRSAARQMTNLINSVISFNQLRTDRPVDSPLPLDIGGVCSAIAAEVESVWGAGHKCNVAIASDCGSLLLDEILFRRILENLLTNAFRYTPSAGTVSLHVRREMNRLLMDIIDTGIGIPEEDQVLIFDAFYRSRNVEGRRGLGLGLSIVQEALLQMGGTITVTSRTGEGTAMRVAIPLPLIPGNINSLTGIIGAKSCTQS